ncbi:outer membrane beta-barrel protein [Rufibacter sp. LB8]|uniref:outer membrane beta-barrel protein n=1 Tax=Rufibacter sp. LB8 TaxID=2777781 RepID=UPI00178C20A8|nr:outer membrane beta-barrel protein [Rufibacter sp. LB8]
MKKSSNEENQRHSVEDVFRNGFEGAQTPPSARLWENLDRELENQELRRYRRQVIWYRAAACLLFLCLAGGLIWKYQTASLQPFAGEVAVRPASAAPETGAVAPGESAPAPEQSIAASQTQDQNPVFGSVSRNEPENATILDKSFPSIASAPGNTTKASNLAGNKPRSKVTEQVASLAQHRALPVQETSNETKAAQSEEVISTLSNETQTLAVATSAVPAVTTAPELQTRANIVDSLAPAGKSLLLLDKPQKVAVESSEKKAIIDGSVNMVSKWSVSLAYVPQYAYSPIKIQPEGNTLAATSAMAQPQMYQSYQKAVEEYNTTYKPGFSYRAVVGASYSINSHWQVESGLLYAQNEASTQHSYLIMEASPAAAGASIVVSEPVFMNYTNINAARANNLSTSNAASRVTVAPTAPYSTHYKYQQVGVPLKVSYRHAFQKLFAYVSGGVNLSLLLRNSITPENNQAPPQHFGYNDPHSPFRKWQWSTVTSAGVGYEVNRQLSFMVGPDAMYALSSVLKEEQNQPETIQVGVSLSARWKVFK